MNRISSAQMITKLDRNGLCLDADYASLDLLWTSSSILQGGPIQDSHVNIFECLMTFECHFAMAPVSTNRCPSTDGAKIQTLRLLMLQQICQDILEKQSAAFVRRIDPPMVGGLDRKRFQSSNFSSSNQPWLESCTKNYTEYWDMAIKHVLSFC